jgi:RNA polymerase sigma factor (sigma-70 family)
LHTYSKKEILELIAKAEKLELVFRWILKEYKERLYWLIRRMVIDHADADDVLQETYLKIWQNLRKFRGDSDLYTWIYRIGVNECLTFLQKKKKRLAGMKNYSNDLSEQLHADPWFDGNEAQIKLQKAILTLPAQQRLVFNMRYFEEVKYRDMAEILNKSVGALKANYHHASKKIEEYIKKH